MAVFHYSRVSLEEQTVENQKLSAESSEYKIDFWYNDSGVSGGTPALQRSAFKEMASKMVRGDTLLVSSVDRIGRKTSDVISTVEYFQEHGIKVNVLTYGNIDLTSTIGFAMMSMAAVFAQMDRQEIQRKTREGLKRTQAQGTKLGAPLQITPAVLSQASALIANGVSLTEVCKTHRVARNTLQRNLAKWGDNLQGYEGEFIARQEQYAKVA